MSYVTRKTNKATTKASTTSKTLSLPITTWAQLEQIRTHHGWLDFETTIIKIAAEKYQADGFGLE